MGAAVIAASHRAERHIVKHLRDEGATRADRATVFHAERLIERRRLDRLMRARAVRQEPDGRYWLDEAIYEAYVADRRGLAFVVLGVVGVTAAGIIIASMFR